MLQNALFVKWEYLKTFEKMSFRDNRIYCMQSGTFEQREYQCFATKQCKISEHLGYYPVFLFKKNVNSNARDKIKILPSENKP